MNPGRKRSIGANEGEKAVSVSVSFGSVTIETIQPSKNVRQANIEAGQAALQRAKPALIKAGIKLSREKGVPLYFGCADKPGLLIREIDGRTVIGRFIGGRFRALKEN